MPNSVDFSYGVYDTTGEILKGDLIGYRSLAKQLDAKWIVLSLESEEEGVILGCRFIVQIIGGREERALFIAKCPNKEISLDVIREFYDMAIEEIENLESVKYKVLGLWESGDIEDIEKIMTIEIIDHIYEFVVGKLLANEKITVKSSDLFKSISLLIVLAQELKPLLPLGFRFAVSKLPIVVDLLIRSNETHADADIDRGKYKYAEADRFRKFYQIYKEYIKVGNYNFKNRKELAEAINRKEILYCTSYSSKRFQQDINNIFQSCMDNPDDLICIINQIAEGKRDVREKIRDEVAMEVIKKLAPRADVEGLKNVKLYLLRLYKGIGDTYGKEIREFLIEEDILWEEIVRDAVKQIAEKRDPELLHILTRKSFTDDPKTKERFDRSVKNGVGLLSDEKALSLLKFALDEPERGSGDGEKILIEALSDKIRISGRKVRLRDKQMQKLSEFRIVLPGVERRSGGVKKAVRAALAMAVMVLIVFSAGVWVGEQYTPSNMITDIFNSTSSPTLFPASPMIINSAPKTPVYDDLGAARIFSIIADQTVNVTWLINGTRIQLMNKSVTEASYTNTSAAVGVWNVSAIVENANGTEMQTWMWNVTSTPILAQSPIPDETESPQI